jgi:scavenger receptor class B, member 1
VPIYLDIYLFNWTNPEEIKNSSSRPHFTQLGPYRFREYPDKLNISFDATNSSVTYRKMSTYFFDAEGSNGSLSDICTSVNMVTVGAGNKAKDWGWFKQKSVSMSLGVYHQELHVVKTVAELLFDGYEDDLVSLSSIFDNDTPFDRVGLFVKRNATDILSGAYTVNTGVDDIYRLGQIEKYDNLTEFPYHTDDCRKLRGSAGEFFSPEPTKDDPIYLFTPNMCRAIAYEYEKDISLHGVMGYRFSAGAKALDNGTLYASNQCFATKGEEMPSGVMNISACNYGHPMFMSFPHFYGADSSYLEAVDGLSPDKEKHQTFITLEPVSKTNIFD